jgi:hypothetical protein
MKDAPQRPPATLISRPGADEKVNAIWHHHRAEEQIALVTKVATRIKHHAARFRCEVDALRPEGYEVDGTTLLPVRQPPSR